MLGLAAIRLNPKDDAAYHGRGNAYAAKGEHEKALSDLTEAIRLNPKNAEAYRDRGQVYEKKGEKSKAEGDFVQSKKLGYKTN